MVRKRRKRTIRERLAAILLSDAARVWTLAELTLALYPKRQTRRDRQSAYNAACKAITKIGWCQLPGRKVRYASAEVATTYAAKSASVVKLAKSIESILSSRANKPMTTGDVLLQLYPADPDRERYHDEVEDALKATARSLGWQSGQFRDGGGRWFASKEVAATLRPPQTIAWDAARPALLSGDPIALRIHRVFRTHSGDEITAGDLARAAFRDMAMHMAVLEAVEVVGPEVAKALGWATDWRSGGHVFVRTAVDDNKPTFEEATT